MALPCEPVAPAADLTPAPPQTSRAMLHVIADRSPEAVLSTREGSGLKPAEKACGRPVRYCLIAPKEEPKRWVPHAHSIRQIAIASASLTSRAVIASLIDQPTMRRNTSDVLP